MRYWWTLTQDKPPLNMSLLAMAVGFKHKTHVDAIVRRVKGSVSRVWVNGGTVSLGSESFRILVEK